MKKLLVGLLAVGSISIFASENKILTFENQVYPEYSIIAKCIDSDCEQFTLEPRNENELVEYKYIFSSVKIEQIAKNRRKTSDKKADVEYYSLTKNAFDNAKRAKKESYYGKMIVSSVGGVAGSLLGTIALPIKLIQEIPTYTTKDSFEDKRLAKRFLKNYINLIKTSTSDNVLLTHKEFSKLLRYTYYRGQTGHALFRSTRRLLSDQYVEEMNNSILSDLINYKYKNCSARFGILGDELRLSVNGKWVRTAYYGGGYNSYDRVEEKIAEKKFKVSLEKMSSYVRENCHYK